MCPSLINCYGLGWGRSLIVKIEKILPVPMWKDSSQSREADIPRDACYKKFWDGSFILGIWQADDTMKIVLEENSVEMAKGGPFDTVVIVFESIFNKKL